MNLVYCAQFRDLTGYGVAARSYLKALDAHIENNNVDVNLKIYTPIVMKSNRLSKEETDLIEKYEFKNDEDINKTIEEDYVFVWHMAPALIMFSDEKFRPSPNCSPSLTKLIKCAKNNINLVAWETDKIPREWQEVYDYYKPDLIITPSDWNTDTYKKSGIRTVTVPHVIEESSEVPAKIDLPLDLDDKFVIFAMSQWSQRKGFDKLIQAFASELGTKEDCMLIIKTYESPGYDINRIQQEVKYFKNSIYKPSKEKKQNNIILIPGFMPQQNISWLHKKSDIFCSLSKGEGFGLPTSEALINEKPVIVPKEGGHVDYINPEAAFYVDGHWDSCMIGQPPYECDGNVYEPHLNSARQQLKKAYDMWKTSPEKLAEMGRRGAAHIKESGYSTDAVGRSFIEAVASTQTKTLCSTIKETQSKSKKNELKKKIQISNSLQDKIDALKGAYKGETCYILSCGPSMKSQEPAILSDFLKDKLVFSIKQAYDIYSKETDFHFFNCANLPPTTNLHVAQHYDYDKDEPIIVASSNYDLGKRWYPKQKTDIFFKVPIRTEINNEFVVRTKKFNDFLLEKDLTRPCGPGIMYETVIYLAAHLGVSEIVVFGWDLSEASSAKEHKHFYGGTSNLINRGDVMDWEVREAQEASKDLYYWLKDTGIQLKLASDQSALYEGIPRVTLEELKSAC